MATTRSSTPRPAALPLPRTEAGKALLTRLGWFLSEKGDPLNDAVAAIEAEAVGDLVTRAEAEAVVAELVERNVDRVLAEAARREAGLRAAAESVSDHHNGEPGHDPNDSCWRVLYAALQEGTP